MTEGTTGKSFEQMSVELLDVLPCLYMYTNATELVKASASVVNMIRGASNGYKNISGMLELYNKYCLGSNELYAKLEADNNKECITLFDKEKALLVALSKRGEVVDVRMFDKYFKEYLEPMRNMDSNYPYSREVLKYIRRIQALQELNKVLDSLIDEVNSYEEVV